MRSETYAKLCDRVVVLKACQRHEDASARRLCNLCGGETQGSVMPQRGIPRECSFYRGTCIGSVEKRIRGIVPPNADIIGQTPFGGLRYCKEQTTFSSVQHYYTDADIMQVGQTCREGTTPVYEGWDWTKQHDNPNTARDRFGTACLDPSDERTCPSSRYCVDGGGCYTDTPNWMRIEELIKHWGLAKLKQFADDPNCNSYGTQGVSAQDVALSEDETLVQIPCTFKTHQVVLTPSNANQFADWPFLDSNTRAATDIQWSLEGRNIPPPPPPVPEFVFIG